MASIYRYILNQFFVKSFLLRAANSACSIVILLTFSLAANQSYAQEELYDQKIAVYGVNSNNKIAEVPVTAKYKVLSSQGTTNIVQFLQPTLTGWVSKDYVSINGNTNNAVVTTNVLNVRKEPGLNALKISYVTLGYKSSILEHKNGFIKIFLPTSLNFKIDNAGSKFEEKWRGLGKKTRPIPILEIAPVVNKPALTNQDKSVKQTSSLTLDGAENESSENNKNEFNITKSELEPNLISNIDETHLLAPGDAISLVVFGEPDLSAQNVKVPQNGRVSFPLIGPVKVLGKTTSEVEESVAQLLSKGYVKNPILSVSIFSYRPIFIRGEVNSSGSFPYSAGLTVAKAIAVAGGLTDSAKLNGISISRDGKIIAQSLSADSEERVASGDIVSVIADLEIKEADSAYIYLHGEVQHSGAYEFQQGLTVEKAVVLAGGFSLRASKKKISISRYEGLNEDGVPLEIKKVKLYEPVRPGDVIKVGASWF